MAEAFITSLLAFVSTNLDDIIILALFFGSRKYSQHNIFPGQYLGIFSLVIISYTFAQVGNFIHPRYIGLLGFLPIYLSIKQLIALFRKGDADEVQIDHSKAGIIAIAGVTLANGSDNMGVYVPLFATLNNFHFMILIIVFAIMTGIWCMLGKYLARNALLAKTITRFGHIIMPGVLFLLGVYILFESNAIYLFL